MSHEQSSESQCKTKDGRRIISGANVGTISEAQLARKNGAEGIGLLRTEFFYISQKTALGQNEETEFYRNIIDVFKPHPVTFRLLDVGSDKVALYLPSHYESNPQMGIRGIRYLYRYPEIMFRQLKCILNAHAGRKENIRILLPFITVKEDLLEARKRIEKAVCEFGGDMNRVQIGIMVEVPSVALDIENFLDDVDFISIGTNDLLQYIYAVSREDIGLEKYRNYFHPLMLRIMSGIIKSAVSKNVPISVCGEMAGDPVAACVLIGMGVKYLSMQFQSLPYVKEKIVKQSFRRMKSLSEKLLACENLKETEKLIKEI